MSDEQKGLKVAGYRATQPSERIDRADRIKAMEERFYRLIDEMTAANTASLADAADASVQFDPRDMAIARTHIQEGCSVLVRAIFRPKRLTDDELAAIEAPDA